MSILSVDQISPIGTGTTITLNATEVKTGTEITVGTGASIFSPAGNTLTLGTNNVERIRIKNDGKVGIGTNNPTAKLEIKGSDNPLVKIVQDTSGIARLNLESATNDGYQYSGIGLGDGTNDAELMWTTQGFDINVGNAVRFRIKSGGDISIGGMDANTFSNYRTLTIGGAGAVDGAGIDLERSDGNIYGRFFADANGVQIQSSQAGDHIRFETDGSNERMRINAAGAVVTGICTATTFEATTFSKTPTNTPAFHAWSSPVISPAIPDATLTKVEFLVTETLDTDNAYDNSSSGTTANRFTVPAGKTGFYHVSAGLNFYANLNDIRHCRMVIKQNNSIKMTAYGFISSYAAGTRHFQCNLSGILELANDGDYLELFAFLDTNGGSQGYISNDAQGYRGNFFSAFKLII